MFNSFKKILGFRPDYKDIGEAYSAGDFDFVFAYYKIRTEKREPSAVHVLATLYKNGVGTEVNTEKYKELLKLAADLGHVDAKWEYIESLIDDPSENNAEEQERHLVEIGQSEDETAVNAWRALGRMFSNGTGVSVDGKKAAFYYQMAAELGDAEGINSLGCLLRDGKIVEKNAKLAATYFLIGVEKLQDSDSKIFLGMMYKDGEGVPKSIDKAIELFTSAAEKENSLAMHLLSQIYRDDNSKRNLVLAYKWLNLAAMEFDYLREHRDLLEEEMDSEQVSLGQQLCNEWHAAHAVI